eukprot:CAMPEP_0117057852 /NCGR_PEP_ID=MMETSP0472-20121206/40194_1 /TAXON_ID=693140 ORGANISM="Tiarina fusus, Strain LIS" /NCGR_SAMPLE_ID=MMETSP0472 /ASSEMBLY_ACC=CAM_ASM_000603 /LENGTH=248 /DNA_ID=CAMNT_0004774959 /DNA_START=173 /DNA_END=915 /DNA_ORIENTATION=-
MKVAAMETTSTSLGDTVETSASKDGESTGDKDESEQAGHGVNDDAKAPEEGNAKESPPKSTDEQKTTDKLASGHYTRSKDPKAKKDGNKKKRSRKSRQRRTPKIFLDSISVVIPLDVTADLKIAIQRTRAKRIKSIYKRFPVLKKEKRKRDEENNDEPMLDDEDDDNKDKDSKAQQQPKKKKKLENVPQPEQYGSVLDYLEAKYVKGVQLEDMDEDGRNSTDDKSEGQGSVYSGGSFLDDTDLQRDVA